MNERMREELTGCFGELVQSTEARVIVVTGAGERAFSPAPTSVSSWRPRCPSAPRRRRRVDFRAAMDRCGQPIIAAIRGFASAAASSWRSPATSGSPARTPARLTE